MTAFGLNHMTVSRLSTRQLFDIAKAVGCSGVELRNDLAGQPFDGGAPETAAEISAQTGLAIFGLAELKSFNVKTASRIAEAEALIAQAVACGAGGVALIPHVGDGELPRAAQKEALKDALEVLRPLLEGQGVTGLIEPLGFPTSTLRFKEDVVSVLSDMGNPGCFAIVHDTFHHCLAGETQVFAAQTAIVHVSGVVDPSVAVEEMQDAHRVLVDADDRLGNIAQLRALIADGYDGPISVEAFSEDIRKLTDPVSALAGSFAFITSQLTEETAGAA